MKLPMRNKKSTPIPTAAQLLFHAEQMKGLGGTSPTQRAYRSHTSDLITRLDRLLAPKKPQASADAGKRKADAQGAGSAAGPFSKSRPRNIVLRDLVETLTKIWRDDKSLELIEKKRDQMVPSPPAFEDHATLSDAVKVEESADAPEQKVAPMVAIKTDAHTLRCSAFQEEVSFGSMASDLNIGFNTEPFLDMGWNTAGSLPIGPVPQSRRLSCPEVFSFLEEQPVVVKREEDSCCTSPSSDEDFDSQSFMMEPETPPESPFEEPPVVCRVTDFGFGLGCSWSFPVDESAPLTAW